MDDLSHPGEIQLVSLSCVPNESSSKNDCSDPHKGEINKECITESHIYMLWTGFPRITRNLVHLQKFESSARKPK